MFIFIFHILINILIKTKFSELILYLKKENEWLATSDYISFWQNIEYVHSTTTTTNIEHILLYLLAVY